MGWDGMGWDGMELSGGRGSRWRPSGVERCGDFIGAGEGTNDPHGAVAALANREVDAEDAGEQTHPRQAMPGGIEQLLLERGLSQSAPYLQRLTQSRTLSTTPPLGPSSVPANWRSMALVPYERKPSALVPYNSRPNALVTPSTGPAPARSAALQPNLVPTREELRVERKRLQRHESKLVVHHARDGRPVLLAGL